MITKDYNNDYYCLHFIPHLLGLCKFMFPPAPFNLFQIEFSLFLYNGLVAFKHQSKLQ